MVKKTKFSTITAVIVTIAALTALGSIGGGIGLGQQQTALAQIVHSSDIGEDDESSIVPEECTIVPMPDVCLAVPDVSSRIPDISSIVPLPDTSFIAPDVSSRIP